MKKALIVLLILAVAGGLFAQEVSWTGEVDTGIRIDIKDDNPVKGDDDDGHAVKYSLGATYDADDWGLKIAGGGKNTGGYAMAFDNAYGWMFLSDKLLKLSAGKIDDAAWGNGGETDTDVDTGPGIRLEVLPIDGLSVGAFFTYPAPAKGAEKPDGVSAGKLSNFFQQTAFGFKYGADTFTVDAALRLFSEEDAYTTTNDTDAKFIFGFGFTGIQSLAVYVDGVFDHVLKMSDVGEEEIWESVKFTGIDNLGLKLTLGEGFVKSFELDWFKAKVAIDYAVSDTTSVGVDGNGKMAKNAKDDLAFASWGFDVWGKYELGGAWVKGILGVDGYTKDYLKPATSTGFDDPDSTAPYVRVLFGYSF